MKKFLIGVSFLAAAHSAQAGVSGDFRFDAESKSVKTPATESAAAEEKNTFLYQAQRAKITLSGDVAEGLAFIGRLDLKKVKGDDGRDELGSMVEYAYLTHTLTDMFAVKAGKLYTNNCGLETGSNNGGDIYVYSAQNPCFDNQAGVALDAKFGDHVVTLEAFNSSAASANGENVNGMGLSYKGKVSVLTPHISYSTDPKGDAGDETSLLGTYLTAGTELAVIEGYNIQLEYISTSFSGKKANGDTATASIAGPVVLIKGTEGMYRPYFKYAMADTSDKDGLTYGKDKNDKALTDKAKNTDMALALEVYPTEKMRYHVAYVSSTRKPDGGPTTTETKILAGVKITADFLK